MCVSAEITALRGRLKQDTIARLPAALTTAHVHRTQWNQGCNSSCTVCVTQTTASSCMRNMVLAPSTCFSRFRSPAGLTVCKLTYSVTWPRTNKAPIIVFIWTMYTLMCPSYQQQHTSVAGLLWPSWTGKSIWWRTMPSDDFPREAAVSPALS